MQNLENDGGRQHVAAHGAVLVERAGARLATPPRPQQTGPVDQGAEGDGSRNTS